MAASVDTHATTCDLRFGQVGLANVRVFNDDAQALRAELTAKVTAAPALFARAAVVLDLSRLDALPADERVRALLDAVRDAGMLPVGLAYGTTAMGELAERLGLPSIARFRAAYEPAAAAPAAAPAAPRPASSVPAPEPAPEPAAGVGTLHHAQPVRSGQQVYAQGGDLVVTAHVAPGAEVIADGSIHVYGRLRGRALAGAVGNEQARIYCSEFRAQLVSIAGHYRVFEEVPAEFDGHAVQCWLDGDQLMLARL